VSALTMLEINYREFDTQSVPEIVPADPAARLRYAFLILLAANVFVISGVACFAALYFWQ
jgi:hypothetical protein